MRIKKVSVKKFKNLTNFECEFSESNISAFIGINGAGKSNILELITRAFSNAMNYYCGKKLPIVSIDKKASVADCIIEYEQNGNTYKLFYNENISDIKKEARENDETGFCETISIKKDEKIVKKSDYLVALPSNILLYYAGETKRQKKYADNTYDSIYDNKLKKANSYELPGLKFMEYYGIDDLRLLLVALSVYKGPSYKKILEKLNCESIEDKFCMTFGRPEKGKGSFETYWNSTGFVKNFIDELRKYVVKSKDDDDEYIMEFDSMKFLKKLANDEFELFAKLKALKNYGILKHVKIQLIKNDGCSFYYSRLSEGEKQFALIYLLTAFTKNENCLYLFDEFDAYLHLNWQRFISQMLNETNVKGHVIFTTHSPASISKLKQNDVYILNEGKVYNAYSETFNRSLDEIMEELMGVSLRSQEYTDLERQFRNAVAHNQRSVAEEVLRKIKKIIGADDPFFITARIVMERMK